MSKTKENRNKLESAGDRQFVMWAGTLRALPLLERMKVTKAAGFDVLSFTTVDYAKAVAGGLDAKDILSLARDHGIRITHMDPLTRWTPVWEPDGIFDKSVLPFFDCEQDEFFRIAEALGIQSMHVLGMFQPGALPVGRITESYIAVCDRAASLGICCSLEFIPFTGIRDLATAWSIVKSAGGENSGIIFDFWHFMRSTPDFDLLSEIAGRFIGGVQFADAKMNFLRVSRSCRIVSSIAWPPVKASSLSSAFCKRSIRSAP
jgi:sugar phosphate isomerase/epimerase